MTPLDFVHFDGDSSPNDPIYKLYEAMKKPITVVGPNGELEILSYYLDNGQMILEVE